MADDDNIHLNGTSQQFLADFAVVKEKLLNHLEHADKQDEELKHINRKLDNFLETLTKHKTYFKLIGAAASIVLAGVVTWAVATIA